MPRKESGKKGRFIVFEGIDGSGKNTQSNLLYDVLCAKGRKCLLTSEPSGGEIGVFAREELGRRLGGIDMRTLQFLFMADRSDHVERVIKPNLSQGIDVISSRYFYSTVVYGAAFGSRFAMDMKWLLEANTLFPKPDVVFFIDVPPEVGYENVKRRAGKKERFEELGDLKLTCEYYRKLSRKVSGTRWIRINGNRPRAVVAKSITKEFEELGL
ncbi:MAG: dTMP kinase [Candidatus Micrarchaeota archaeon]|nr:dTMP kinase [Candidatus Micrarchaeota archaeon]MDE1847816.1 dTMP kinase [Candidatus Micrarchaeota archaeon]MDE1864378.1 dTMP kinase [Candidatus Micrarchaeota archaeon]